MTSIQAHSPFAAEAEARAWLERSAADEEAVDALLAEAVALLNRALHANAVAAADPALPTLGAERALAARIGFGSGEEVAESAFAAALEVDPGVDRGSRRRRRDEELRPQERLAATLAGRERIDVCETLLLRARADLDADREREAALQLDAGLAALLTELQSGPQDPGHENDMAALAERRSEAADAAAAAVAGQLTAAQFHAVRDLLELSERILRRRRILGG
ncbi:MAG TPA: hypothetical protein VMT37_08775 [Solirubrobacterales bacterium]|nr:hypothetical protein [Solirubrobacterales bacterium]